MTFQKETFRQKHFGTINVLACVPFVPRDVLAHIMEILSLWMFQRVDILAPWAFWHGDIMAMGRFGTGAKMSLCWNSHIAVHGPKISLCQNGLVLSDVSVPEPQRYQNIPMRKCLGALIFLWQNIHSTKIFKCLNVYGEQNMYWMCFIPWSIIFPLPLIRACFVSIFANNQLRKLTAKGY